MLVKGQNTPKMCCAISISKKKAVKNSYFFIIDSLSLFYDKYAPNGNETHQNHSKQAIAYIFTTMMRRVKSRRLVTIINVQLSTLNLHTYL